MAVTSHFNLVDRAMREAQERSRAAARGSSGSYMGAPRAGTLSDWLGQWRDAFDMITGQATPEQQLESQLAASVKSNMDGGMSFQQALAKTFQDNPGALMHSLLMGTGGDLVKALTPAERHVHVLGNQLVDDNTGQVVATNNQYKMPTGEMGLAFLASGYNPASGQPPTNAEVAAARSFAAKKFDRPPTEFDELWNQMSPTQRQQMIENKANPAANQHSTMFKLTQERDAAKAAGRFDDAASYQKEIDALPKQSLLQTLLGNDGGGGGPLPAPQPGAQPGSTPAPDQPSAGLSAIRNQAITSAAQQAVSTKQPVTFVDPLDKSQYVLTPDKAAMILQNAQAAAQAPAQPAPAPDTGDETPPPEKPATPAQQ